MDEQLESRRPLYFLHIPKTACTSLRRILERAAPPGALLALYPPLDAALLSSAREALQSDTRVVFGHLNHGIADVLGRPGTYATLLRDPVDRVVSYYRHNVAHAQAEHHERLQGGMGLAAFVEQRVTFETNNHMTRILAGWPGTDPLDDDAALVRALDHLRRDFVLVGTQERFSVAVSELLAWLGWRDPFAGDHPRLNRARGSELELDASTRALIEHENRLDIALYRAVTEDEG